MHGREHPKQGGTMSISKQKKEKNVLFERQSGKNSLKTVLPLKDARILTYVEVLKPYFMASLVFVLLLCNPYLGLAGGALSLLAKFMKD